MDNGWILLHRKLLDNPICKNPTWAFLWIVLLLLASHKEKDDFIWNGKITKLKKGQFITGRKKLKELTNIPETTIERALTYLEKSGHQIGQQKTTKFRLITILNWDKYQKLDSKADNRRTTDGQQTDTINNDNNDNNDNNILAAKPPDEVNQLIQFFKDKVNPHIQFNNKTERKACTDLINAYGLEKIKSALVFLEEKRKTDKYLPQITTPYELWTKWAKIKQHLTTKTPKIWKPSHTLSSLPATTTK